jgi:FKBP-type peptidyl-prolyl cis-trans isomerase SlyD
VKISGYIKEKLVTETNTPETIKDDVVVQIEYVLTVDGHVVDSTDDREPLEYLHGHQNIIPGLEKELSGMKTGESKKVDVAPADGYGEFNPEGIMDVPRREFPDTIPMKIGTELQVRDQDDEVQYAIIKEIGDEIVKLDFNHPLAGKKLNFDVKIAALRAPSEEELAHGHVHTHGHEH